LPFVPLRVGGWWRANQEIDAVAVGPDAVLLAECQWSRRPIGLDILRALERKVLAAGHELEARRRFLSLFSRSGFTPQVKEDAAQRDDLFLFDLAQIAGETRQQP
jgi:hypothetical protein